MQYNGGSGYGDSSRQRAHLPRQQQPAPVRPPRSTPPRKRKKRIVVKPRFFVFLLVCVLLLVGLFLGIRAAVQALVNTEATVTYGMIEDVTTVNALVIRNEECVRAEGYGEIQYLVPEMSYVSADTPILEVYATGYSGDSVQELDKLRTEIVQRQKETVLGNIVNASLEQYNTEIDAQVDAISAAMRDNPAQMDALNTQLITLMDARQDYIETMTEATSDSTLNQYYANETQLE
ncbi:MAG: HlyD family efflux transporter periplasmic adaptor subunit, partial [Candidatus Spyradocola sp.]